MHFPSSQVVVSLFASTLLFAQTSTPAAPMAEDRDASYRIYSSLLPLGETASQGWPRGLWLVEDKTVTVVRQDHPCVPPASSNPLGHLDDSMNPHFAVHPPDTIRRISTKSSRTLMLTAMKVSPRSRSQALGTVRYPSSSHARRTEGISIDQVQGAPRSSCCRKVQRSPGPLRFQRSLLQCPSYGRTGVRNPLVWQPLRARIMDRPGPRKRALEAASLECHDMDFLESLAVQFALSRNDADSVDCIPCLRDERCSPD